MDTNVQETRKSQPKPEQPPKPTRKSPANIAERYLEVLRLRQRLSEAEEGRPTR